MSARATRFEFGRVDETVDPGSFVDYLDSVGRMMQEHKRLSFGLQDVKPGDTLLDLGCGPGDDARALAALVGAGGRVIGVDNSETMIAEARRRSEGSGLPVEFQVGEAHRLELADGELDGARAERVFQHLPDPRRALTELARVTRPGGRIAIGPDPDWEALVIDCADAGLMRRIKNVFVDGVASGSVAHELPGLMRELGLEDVTVTAATLVLTQLGAAELVFELSRVAERACDAGVISDHERAGWIQDLQARDESGRFFLAVTGFVTAAQKSRSARE